MSTEHQEPARSTKPTKNKAEPFCARIDPDLVAYLRAIAARNRRPVAMQLAVILEEYRAQHDA